MSAADLIAMGVDVASQDEDCGLVVRGLDDLLKSEGDSADESAALLRAIVTSLRDAADGAVDVHTHFTGSAKGEPLDRVRAFSRYMSLALREIS